ncbi:MAG: alkene reductase [Caldimonas sp.]
MSLLFSPLRVGALALPSRVVMAPMTRARSGPDGVPTPLMARYYAQRATAGLIVAEATQIDAEGQGYVRTPGIHTEAQVKGWRQVTAAVHAAGGKIVLQLWHVGRVSHPDNRAPGTRSVGPSPIAPRVRIFTATGIHPAPVPHELAAQEIKAIVQQYARAARSAVVAGFDGVEIHAGNGYLIDQFLHESSNQRTDAYGGTAQGRSRLLWEVCEAVCLAVGKDRTGVRLSPFGVFNDVDDSNAEDLFDVAIRGLTATKPAYLHVINPEVSGDRSVSVTGVDDVARFSRARFEGALMVAGSYEAESAERTLREGTADLIAFGRPYIANPDLALRLREGVTLASADRATFYTEGERGYTDYPAAPLRQTAR